MDEFHKKFGKIFMEEQVRASLQRLSSKNLCIFVENRYKASKKAKMEMMEGIHRSQVFNFIWSKSNAPHNLPKEHCAISPGEVLSHGERLQL